MPKATADFDNFPKPGKNEIGRAGQFGLMQPVSKSHPVHKTAYRQFSLGVLGPYPPHVFRTAFGANFVGHTARSSGRSAMSFSRFPFTIILSISSESAKPKAFTAAANSGKAK